MADPELPAVHEQLIVFAREIGELYRLERTRSAELERTLAQLQETYIATMKSLAQVIEAKDRATRGHLDRTQEYGLALAARIDPSVATEELSYGFFLHDIGKVGIPEHILRKEGPLSADEWAVMRTHPMVGAQIVAPITFLGMRSTSCATTTSGSTAAAIRTACVETPSPSWPGSSWWSIRSTR